jgi:hypothetical protein
MIGVVWTIFIVMGILKYRIYLTVF